jgi:acyl-[acyl-carrier-protein]-phospholipid O-acyltransferase / long-chain-fatty-acid--[acyl-carrier-protein] ligase
MSLHEEILKASKKYKNNIAITDSLTGQTYTYGRMMTAALLFSDVIKKKEDEFIGLMMPMTAGAFISLLAVLISGRVPVIINYSTGAESNIKYARSKCGFNTVITSKKLCEKLEVEHKDGMIYVEEMIEAINISQKIVAAAKSILPDFFIAGRSPDDIAVILFTTGSEKEPKAVMLTHDTIMSNVESLKKIFHFDENDIFIGVLPLFHIYGLTTSFFLPLTSGAAVNTYPNPLDYKNVAYGIKKNKGTIITATPTFLRGYCQRSEPGDFRSLRIIMAGGDKLTGSLRDMYLEKHGAKVLEGYGTTETSPVISVNTQEHNRFGSIGKVIPGAEVKIIDVETEQELPPGQEGKIYVRGRLVMKGYFYDLEETSLRIHNGWYDTGDIGMFDNDGYLWHKGRLKRFVKIGGEMISLTAIENAVEKYIGEDHQCCAVGLPHVSKGAEIAVAVTSDVHENELKKELKAELSPIAVPKRVIKFKELPLMGNGKVNFRAVEEMCRRGKVI